MTRLISLLAILVIVLGGMAFFPGSTEAATFAVGDQVVVATDGLNYREAPDLSAQVIDVLPFGARFTVSDGPVGADGYSWYRIHPDGPLTGWVVGEFLELAPEDDGYPIGTAVVVNDDGVNLRQGIGTDTPVLAVLPFGANATVLAGSRPGDGYDWYRVVAIGYGFGWVAADFLSIAGDDAVFSVPSKVFATSELNLRAEPGLDAAVVRVIREGTAFTLTDGPVSADGHTWYEAAFREGSKGEGWVAGEFLAFYATFAFGQQVVVADGPLNYRARPGLNGRIDAALPTGWVAGVVAGPVVIDGYTWYEISADGASAGWVAGEFLAPT